MFVFVSFRNVPLYHSFHFDDTTTLMRLWIVHGLSFVYADKFYLVSMSTLPPSHPDRYYFSKILNFCSHLNQQVLKMYPRVATDNELRYEPFHRDFGPLNMAMLYRYCTRLSMLLKVWGAAICEFFLSLFFFHIAQYFALLKFSLYNIKTKSYTTGRSKTYK